MQNQNDQPSSSTISQSFNAIYAIATIYATCVLPVFRTGMGSHALGFNAFFALVLMVMAGGFMTAPEMLTYIGAWLCIVILHRIACASRRLRGIPPIHSRYTGDSWWAVIPTVNQRGAKAILEPFSTGFIAMCIQHLSQPMSNFLLGAAIAMFVKNLIDVEVDRARVRRMRDAHIEQTAVTRMYKQGE